MKKINKSSEIKQKFYFPLMGYPGYAIAKFFDKFRSVSLLLAKLETITLRKEINKIKIDRPIYITGLVRSGTTIILEMLSKHPDIASHRYKHMLAPYFPHLLSFIASKTNIYLKPVERLHKDGIFVTRESPEAVEEMLWQKFFINIHDENQSNILDKNVSNEKFDSFYRDHIRKLMINQNSYRYLAKNNYNITRIEYLLRLFPDLRFLLVIRNPINHVASLIKQTKLFIELEHFNPLIIDWSMIIGHHEFGHNRVCINVDNTDEIQRIRKFWQNKKTYVKGWAHYWCSIYDFIAKSLDNNKKFKEATLIVKYEDLCRAPGKIIDEILAHTELPLKKFENIKKYYIKHLKNPTYYTPNFSKQELSDISEITKSTLVRYMNIDLKKN